MKRISVYGEGTRYELAEQDVIKLHTKLRLIHEAIDNILMDYADFDPSTVKTLTDIDTYVMDARDVLVIDASAACRVDIKSKHPNCNVKDNIFGYKVEMSEEEWQKISLDVCLKWLILVQ